MNNKLMFQEYYLREHVDDQSVWSRIDYSRTKLSIDFLREFADKIDWQSLIKDRKEFFDTEFLEEMRKYIDFYDYGWTLYYNGVIKPQFILKYMEIFKD